MTEIEKLKAAFEAADADRNAALDVAYAAYDAAARAAYAARVAYHAFLVAQAKETPNE